MWLRLTITLCVLAVQGCKRPPDAPDELNELCAYLFDHVADDDATALEVGADNLGAWLDDNLASTLEGYLVSDLDQSSVDALDSAERDLTGLVGAAVGNGHDHRVADIAHALIAADQEEVFPDDYDVFERTWDGDPDCFLGGACERISASNYSEARYALGLRVTSTNSAEFRWVETAAGTALVHRAWLDEPANVSIVGVQVEQQYFLTAALPLDDGTAVRLQAVWLVAEIVGVDVPEATALSMIIGSMRSTGESLEAWLSDQ